MKPYFLAAASGLVLAACSGSDTAPAVDPEAALETLTETEEAPVEAESQGVKLYTFDCGTIEISDIGVFASDGSYDGLSDTYADGCFAIVHPKGTLLWDLGLPGGLAGADPTTNGIFTVSLSRTLGDQLADAGIDKIDYMAISHLHFDHTGQPEAAGGAMWIVHEDELAAMQADTETDFSAFFAMDHMTFSGDHDVFGDGTVTILALPGHTPGHTSLLLKLDNAGPVMLTGDMYHRQESRDRKLVPQFNSDAEQSLESMARFEELAGELGARVIIQHSRADLAALPQPLD